MKGLTLRWSFAHPWRFLYSIYRQNWLSLPRTWKPCNGCWKQSNWKVCILAKILTLLKIFQPLSLLSNFAIGQRYTVSIKRAKPGQLPLRSLQQMTQTVSPSAARCIVTANNKTFVCSKQRSSSSGKMTGVFFELSKDGVHSNRCVRSSPGTLQTYRRKAPKADTTLLCQRNHWTCWKGVAW